jgi:hypothetical protein
MGQCNVASPRDTSEETSLRPHVHCTAGRKGAVGTDKHAPLHTAHCQGVTAMFVCWYFVPQPETFGNAAACLAVPRVLRAAGLCAGLLLLLCDHVRAIFMGGGCAVGGAPAGVFPHDTGLATGFGAGAAAWGGGFFGADNATGKGTTRQREDDDDGRPDGDVEAFPTTDGAWLTTDEIASGSGGSTSGGSEDQEDEEDEDEPSLATPITRFQAFAPPKLAAKPLAGSAFNGGMGAGAAVADDGAAASAGCGAAAATLPATARRQPTRRKPTTAGGIGADGATEGVATTGTSPVAGTSPAGMFGVTGGWGGAALVPPVAHTAQAVVPPAAVGFGGGVGGGAALGGGFARVRYFGLEPPLSRPYPGPQGGPMSNTRMRMYCRPPKPGHLINGVSGRQVVLSHCRAASAARGEYAVWSPGPGGRLTVQPSTVLTATNSITFREGRAVTAQDVGAVVTCKVLKRQKPQ